MVIRYIRLWMESCIKKKGLLGMYEKNGQPLEKLLSYYVQSRFVRPKIRPYKTNNYYAILMKGGATYDSVLEKDR